jgi:hypothetical protein
MSKFDNIIRGTFNIATVVFAFSIIVMSIATITISDASDVSPSESQNFVKPAKAAMIDSNTSTIRDFVGQDATLVQFIEFNEPMYINAKPQLNN